MRTPIFLVDIPILKITFCRETLEHYTLQRYLKHNKEEEKINKKL